ncbi:MAG: hypothetical protein F6K58_30975 [Symploca sp. SIO2E9]|nr:hypothetical protein [Symploca sp. SIO2E9]
MRIWQFWWRTLVLSSQYNPPEFIEHLMILWTLILGLWWGFLPDWPHLVLSASFALGAAMSMLVRELMAPSSRQRSVSVLAILVLLSYSIYAFTQLTPYFRV